MNTNIKTIILISLLTGTQFIFAQKETNNWYFGKNAGITFSSGSVKTVTDGKIYTNEGCATISNSDGELMFYTDGMDVWDRTHTQTPNGKYLYGTTTTTQTLIVPRPDSLGQYYIFTIADEGNSDGLCYSEFDMKLNNGYGDVIKFKKNIQLIKYSCEKVTAVLHSNGKDYWVIGHDFGNDTILSFLVTSSGINKKAVKSATGFVISNDSHPYSIGYLKTSPDGTKIAYANSQYDTLALGNFNSSTGKISKVLKTYLKYGYGLEFSPNGKLLYTTDEAMYRLFQFNAEAKTDSALRVSRVKIDSFPNTNKTGALQLGPDGRIYLSRWGYSYLDAILEPDSAGKKCTFVRNNIYLGGRENRFGLPNFVTSFFLKKNIGYKRNCINDSTFLWPVNTIDLDSVKWNFGDIASGLNNISKSTNNVFHIYKKTGAYKVILYSFFKTKNDTSTITIIVKDPKPFTGKDTAYCNLTSRILTPQKDYLNYKWNTGETTKTITIKTKGTYILTATDYAQCVSSDTITIKNSIALSQFLPRDTSLCKNNNTFQFKNKSVFKDDSLKSLIWKFSDNTNYTDSVFTKSFNTISVYSVTLEIISKNGCKSSLSRKITINPNTSNSFSFNASPQCFNGHDFKFTNLSNLSSGTFTNFWDFGDGGYTSISKDISSKKYKVDSTYRVTLITISDKGCSDTFSKTIIVHPSPKATFAINQQIQCFKWNSFDYTNSSHLRTGTIAFNNWSLGDADFRTIKDIKAKHYNTEDSFNVSLLTISNNACRDSIRKTVYLVPTPKSAFTINSDIQCFHQNGFDYINTTPPAPGGFNTFWELGDSGTSSSNNITGKHYSKSGDYKVSLIITLNTYLNCKDTLTKNIRVDPNPEIKFTIDKDIKCFKEKVLSYTNQSSIAQGTLTYKWSLGDLNTSTSKDIINHKYINEGSYTIKLISTSNANCKDSLSKKVTILTSPAADFTVNDACENDSVLFVNKSVNAETYNWKFGDGEKSGKASPKYLYSIGGIGQTYNVTLITGRSNGCLDSTVKSVSIFALPNSNFSYSINGNQVNFNATSSGNSKYRWLFDNKDSIVGKLSPTFTFKNGMKVCLKVENAFQCISQTCKEIWVGSLSKSEISGFKIYPNPNKGNFSVEMDNPEKDISIEVYNAVGEKVRMVGMPGKVTDINLEVAAGIYLVKVKNGEMVYSQKVSITN